MVNSISVTREGIAAKAEPAEPADAMNFLARKPDLAKNVFFSIDMEALFPFSPTDMVTSDEPELTADDPPPQPAIVVINETTERSNITLLMTNLCLSFGS